MMTLRNIHILENMILSCGEVKTMNMGWQKYILDVVCRIFEVLSGA
jgi:hypothetical protein